MTKSWYNNLVRQMWDRSASCRKSKGIVPKRVDIDTQTDLVIETGKDA